MFHILIVLLLITTSTATEYWSTEQCKYGKKQSPINIPVFGNERIYTGNMRLKYKLNKADIWNNGRSWTLQFVNNNAMLTAPFLNGKYVLDHIHIHWPSEHTINNKRYPLEIHLVFFDESKKTLQQAFLEENHVTVMGVFVEESDTECGKRALKVIANHVPRIRYYKQKVKLNSLINIYDFIPPGPYAFYSGSITTANCNEGVQWIVKMKPLKLCKFQINQLKNLLGEKGEVLWETNRPIQQLNNRTITFYN